MNSFGLTLSGTLNGEICSEEERTSDLLELEEESKYESQKDCH